jgi:hypothetical protein
MGKLIRNIAGILVVAVLNGFGFVGHTSAMPMHDMDGMSHDQTSSANCATLCRTAVIETNKQNKKDTQEENDDEPFIPIYLQLQARHLDDDEHLTKTCQSTIKPPPKVPIHILHCVSRS